MGSACSTDEETRHHRENKKNRNNPTEPYDTWQPKMLLDIGADPLAVIRDFPRMIVYVGTATQHNYLPVGYEGGGAGTAAVRPSAPSRKTSENPLAPATGAPQGGDGVSPAVAGTRPSQREPFKQDDAFANRMRRVREEVVLLSELCQERATFGSAFEAAWDRVVAQSTHDGAAESEAASECLIALQPQSDGRPPLSAAPRRHIRNALPLDVHQTLLNACVESGMIARVEEGGLTAPASTTLRAPVNTAGAAAAAAGAGAQTHSRTSPSGPSHHSRPDSGTATTPFRLPETTGLLSEEAPADYGAGVKAAHVKSKGKTGRAGDKDGAAKSSSNSQTRSANSLPGPGTPGVAPPTGSRYVVRSATFHLMQFATQGVMFFPVQRLKHVLWVPWSSHMQDVSWTIHFTLKDATAADLIGLKQHTLNALYNNASTVLSADGGGLSGGSPQKMTAAVLAASRPSTAENERADAFGAAAAAAVSDSDLRANATTTAAGAAAEPGVKRKIILIQHVQTGRHHVDAADRKTTPRYELDWACSMRVDQETLQEAFAPFQGAAQVQTPQASPLLGNTTNSIPSSHLRRAFRSDDDDANAEGVQRGAAEDVMGESEGLPVAQLPALLQREVVSATVEVIAARVERPPHTMCVVSSTWKKRKEELNYVLEQQYNVHLEETDEMHAKQLY